MPRSAPHHLSLCRLPRAPLAGAALVLALGVPTWAQSPVSATQRATAQQVAQAGVPLNALAADAPDQYTVKSGDTLWAIAAVFLQSPWRWPELWGMNLQDVRNPHRIFPGQQLYLDRSGGRARLRTAQAEAEPEVVKVSPRTRYETLSDSAIPTIATHLIEPFLAEPLVVGETELLNAPRLVATMENRVLLSRGDRAYAMGPEGSPLLYNDEAPREFRVFRNVTPLKNPEDGQILGYEAQYVGKARLVRGEEAGRTRESPTPVAAGVDIIQSKEEMRVGDRLLPEPPRQFNSYVPHAPDGVLAGRIVSVHGSAVVNAAQNQIVVINKGTKDGVETGHVLAIMKNGGQLVDKTDPNRRTIRLPNERNGLLMVFRPFEKVSYALILEITDGVRIGDHVVNPR